MRMPAGATLRGRLFELDPGRPAVGVRVRLRRLDPDRPDAATVYSAPATVEGADGALTEALTQADGRFTIADAPAGLYEAFLPDEVLTFEPPQAGALVSDDRYDITWGGP